MMVQQRIRSIPQRPLSLNKGTGRLGRHGFGFLNAAQFLGALNDNLFKFLNIFLLIDHYGQAASTDVLFWVGLYYVAPFLLFSSTAGILADRFSKQKLIVLLKIAEVIIIGLSFFVFAAKKPWGCYSLIFLLSAHSSLMGPPKYSIIPELVQKEKISKANGFLTSFTYLAIIMGTFLASFLTHVSGHNFLFAVSFCMVAAVVGLILSLYVPHTEPRRNKRKLQANFIKQTYQTLKLCSKTPLLVMTVCGSAFFLFVGAFLQVNIIPFTIENLRSNEIMGGYLFLGSSLGIALGAHIAGKCCKKRIELGLSCIAMFLLGVCLFVLPMMKTISSTAIVLCGLGLFGGLYVVPIESYIQTTSTSNTRGQIVAAENVLSFLGVLLAPICLFFFSKVLQASAALGFMLVALMVFFAIGYAVMKLGGIFFQYLSRQFLQPFFDIHLLGSPFAFRETKTAIVSFQLSWKQIFLLLGESPRIHLFLVREVPLVSDRWVERFANIDFLYYRSMSEEEMCEIVQKKTIAYAQPFFVFSSKAAISHFYRSTYRSYLLESLEYTFRQAVVKHMSHFKPAWNRWWKRTQITYLFDVKTLVQSVVRV